MNTESFTNGKPRIATEEDIERNWSGEAKGKRFRCYLCGHKFKVGDQWRWVFCAPLKVINCLTCVKCDGEYVALKWKAICSEYNKSKRFWALRKR